MSFTKACCSVPPVESNYVPQGKESQFVDLPIYEIGNEKSDRLLICAYDIFGFHPVTKQFCDKLGASGFRVVMPDFFRGKALTKEDFATMERSDIMKFVETTGSWKHVVKKDVEGLIEHYKSLGVSHFGMFGFCWGGKMSLEASLDFPGVIKGITLIHPSMIKTEDGDRVNCPVLSLPSMNEPDMVPFNERVKVKFGEEGAIHVRFDDMPHGFCGARGNMDDENNRKRVDEALALTHNFFDKFLK